jgi:hypothetical protein
MTDALIPHFPVVHGNVYPDGTAHINFAGHDVPLTPTNIDDARAQITSYAVAVDPDGHWTLAAHPDSRVTDLAPAPRPVKRPEWRRAAASGPKVTPPADRRVLDPSSSEDRRAPGRVSSAAAAGTPAWTVSDLPSEAELTVFIERHQQPVPAVPVLLLAFANGATVRVTGAALIGRRPVNNTGASLDVHQVDDPSRNLSRTHFVIVWSDDVPTIIDQHSGNGTAIDRRGVEVIAAPGVAMHLQDGDRLRFGDLTCQITLTAESEVTPDE